VPAQGTARVIMRFDDFADPDMPYMYHCHMLMHEDEGMMGQFVVVDPNSIGEAGAQQALNVWPIPAIGEIHVQVRGIAGACSVSLFDATGRIALSDLISATDGPATIQVGTISPGPYTLRITDSTGNKQVRQVIISH
jgi:hypothetical protein